MFILMLVPLCFDYCIFVVSFEIGKIFNFVLFQVNLGLSVPCIFSRIDFQFLQKKKKKKNKKLFGILIGSALNLPDDFWEYVF